jgi:hypothetical protein
MIFQITLFDFNVLNPNQIAGFSMEFPFITELKAEYGSTLSYDEWLDAHKFIDKYKADMDEVIKGNLFYEQYGVYSVADLYEIQEIWNGIGYIQVDEVMSVPDWSQISEEERERIDILGTMPYPDYVYYYKIENTAWYLEKIGEYFYNDDYVSDILTTRFEDKRQLTPRRIEYLVNKYDIDSQVNLFYSTILYSTSNYYSKFIGLIIISAGILLLPYITRDRRNNMVAMQFASRKGRKIIRTQFTAVMLSAFMLTVIMFSVFMGIYFNHNSEFLPLMNQSVNSVISPWDLLWFDLTYGQYIGVLAIITLFLTMGTAAIIFRLSMYSHDYVSAIMKTIPVIAIFCVIGLLATLDTLNFINALFEMIPIMGIETIICGFVFVFGVVLCMRVSRRVRREDLL